MTQEQQSFTIPIPKNPEDFDKMALQLTIAAAALMPRVSTHKEAEMTALILFNNLRMKLLESVAPQRGTPESTVQS